MKIVFNGNLQAELFILCRSMPEGQQPGAAGQPCLCTPWEIALITPASGCWFVIMMVAPSQQC